MATVTQTQTEQRNTFKKPRSQNLLASPTQTLNQATRASTRHSQVSNQHIAQQLLELAALLERQHANPYRIDAYRRAAGTLRRLPQEVTVILEEKGLKGLIEVPTIGESIARAIRAQITTGRIPLLERLKGESDPEKLLMTIPGIGKKTAQILHCELGIESLEQLELALSDKRLHDLVGIGQKRFEGIRDTLSTRLGHSNKLRLAYALALPSVAELLDVDAEYRQKASKGSLQRIAPLRFNPTGKAWLSVLHTVREQRYYTVLFSNTARAHEQLKTQDWVVIYLEQQGLERQYTVITSQYGAMRGKRIVRGREAECLQYYWPEKS